MSVIHFLAVLTQSQSLWGGFSIEGNTYEPGPDFVPQIYGIYQYLNSPAYLSAPLGWNSSSNFTYYSNGTSPAAAIEPFVYYFNTTGILQHNDIGPLYHPTDFGHVKLASHLIQYIKIMFGWMLYATGPEVQHDTLYWNNQPNY